MKFEVYKFLITKYVKFPFSIMLLQQSGSWNRSMSFRTTSQHLPFFWLVLSKSSMEQPPKKKKGINGAAWSYIDTIFLSNYSRQIQSRKDHLLISSLMFTIKTSKWQKDLKLCPCLNSCPTATIWRLRKEN